MLLDHPFFDLLLRGNMKTIKGWVQVNKMMGIALVAGVNVVCFHLLFDKGLPHKCISSLLLVWNFVNYQVNLTFELVVWSWRWTDWHSTFAEFQNLPLLAIHFTRSAPFFARKKYFILFHVDNITNIDEQTLECST